MVSLVECLILINGSHADAAGKAGGRAGLRRGVQAWHTCRAANASLSLRFGILSRALLCLATTRRSLSNRCSCLDTSSLPAARNDVCAPGGGRRGWGERGRECLEAAGAWCPSHGKGAPPDLHRTKP